MNELPKEILAAAQFGPLPAGFQFQIPSPYTAVVGRNNSGKSSVLQLAFKSAFLDYGADAVCCISADRHWIQPDTQPGSRTLATYNIELNARLSNSPLQYQEGSYGQVGGELFRLLLHRGNFQEELVRVQLLLERLGLPRFILSGPQAVTFDDVVAAAQGSGLRASAGRGLTGYSRAAVHRNR